MVLTVKRPKAAQTIEIPLTINGSLVQDGNDFILKIFFENITPDEFTLSGCNVDIATKRITKSGSGLSKVRIGDVISGSAIETNSVVTEVGTGYIVVDLAPTADVTDNSQVITVTPPTINATLYALKIIPRLINDSKFLDLNIIAGEYDGKLVQDLNGDGEDGVIFADSLRQRSFNTFDIDIDKFFTNARIAREN